MDHPTVPPAGRLPTILTLTQYDIDGGRHGDSASYYAGRGYAFVQAYVRGRGRSGGVKSDDLGAQVGRDGYDLVEWIAAQPWSDGRVVMFGGSFVGMTQWQTAAQLPPHLAAIAPYAPIYPGWDIPNTNGIPQAWTTVILGYVSGRSLNSGFMRNEAYWYGKMLEQYAAYRPFHELAGALGIAPDDWWMLDARGQKRPMFEVWLDHVGDRASNLAAEPKSASYERMNFAVLTATGYYDDDQPGTLRYYRNYVAHAPAAAVARHHFIIGPWDHTGAQEPTALIEGVPIAAAAVIDMQKLHADWYDFALGKGTQPALLRDQVAYFMLGADEWRYAHSLEAASSGKELTFYLGDSDGSPGDLFHSGQLDTEARNTEPPAVLVSDPHELPELRSRNMPPVRISPAASRDLGLRTPSGSLTRTAGGSVLRASASSCPNESGYPAAIGVPGGGEPLAGKYSLQTVRVHNSSGAEHEVGTWSRGGAARAFCRRWTPVRMQLLHVDNRRGGDWHDQRGAAPVRPCGPRVPNDEMVPCRAAAAA